MKKILVFFFFLLLFGQCDDVGNPPSTIKPGPGQAEGIASTHSAIGNSPGINAQPGLSQKITGADKKRRKRSKASPNALIVNTAEAGSRNYDSLFISRLNYLRSTGIEPDLNEPVSKEYLFSPISNRQFPSMIALSRESFLRVNFDNDILDYTDRFYTNGIKIDIIAPGFRSNLLSRLMLPYWSSGTNYYGISLVQNMYTPSTTKTGGILYGDRPYAAYLYVGSFKITNDQIHHLRQTSEIDLGVIGSNSYGEWVQRSFHNSVPTNNEPLGWEYQVQNDLVLNYMVTCEKGVVNRKNLELLLFSNGKLGTLYTSFAGGAQFRAGFINPYFANLGIAGKRALHESGLRKMQFFIFIKGAGKLVGYDATLQGGLFNKSSTYTLPAAEISRVVFEASGGVTFSYNGVRVDVEQFMLSPEFQNGWWHKWVHVALTFCL